MTGASGIGKSALIARFPDSITGGAILRGRCYERESVPFKALDAVVDALSRYLGQLGRVEAAKLTPRYVRDCVSCSRCSPACPRSWTSRRRAAPIPRSFAVARRLGLKQLLVRIAERLPLVIAIDDAQWSDADSASLFVQLLEPPDPAPALWVVGYRSDEVERSPPLAAVADPANRCPASITFLRMRTRSSSTSGTRRERRSSAKAAGSMFAARSATARTHETVGPVPRRRPARCIRLGT